MAQPVWLLSVNLETKTATFQSGLADAAKAARGAFNEIKSGAGEMSEHISSNMFKSRHAVMAVSEMFGETMPRAITALLVDIGPIGAALQAAFPFAAIALAAGLLIKHLYAMHEAGVKLTEDQFKFGTAVQVAFNSLDQKLIEAQIRTDELKNNHLGALQLQLELIDKQSMADLVREFENIAKASDEVMKGLEGHWYSLGIGSDGAKHALEAFGMQYERLMAQGKQDEAGGLLKGTLAQAQRVLQLQKDAKANSGTLISAPSANADLGVSMRAQIELKKSGVGFTEKEISAQEELVQALSAQVTITQKIADIKKADSGNAKTTAGNEAGAQQAAAARQSAESMLRMGEQSIAADRATADAILTVKRASLEARLDSDVDFAGRERDTQLAANAAELSGLDKSGKDYTNQVKANKEKALEIQSEYSTKVAELTAKASIAENARDLQASEQGWREKIESAQEGSADRLSVINTAIKAEQAAYLQDTSFFRELLNMRVETVRQETEEENKLRADAAKEAADNDEKLGALSIAAKKQRVALEDSARRVTIQQRTKEETEAANDEFNNKMKALEREAAGLNKSGKDYDNRLIQMQNREKQLVKENANELAEIKMKAEEESNARILAAEDRRNDAIARGLTQSILGHESWAKMITGLGDQVASGMLQNAIKSILMDDMDKEKDAARAARKGYNIGIGIGGPAGMILGPTFAATAYAGVMAFNSGTDSVPGFGNADTVPALLTPREGVVPGGVMDGLSKVARAGGFNGGGTTNHVHFHPTYNIHTIDGDGMEAALEKNRAQVTKHIEGTLRRMNK